MSVAPAALALFGLPALPTYASGLGSAALLIGEQVLDKKFKAIEFPQQSPAAMFYTAKEELGKLESQRLFEFG